MLPYVNRSDEGTAMNDIEKYRKLAQPPEWALKQISGGRLSGKTDISPQWRYEAMTEQYGLCGIGWKYEVIRLWTEQGSENQVMAFAEVHVFIHDKESPNPNDYWSAPIPGIGGNKLIQKEGRDNKATLYSNDEGYKMAVTDALGTALKMIGVGADIYAGSWDGASYADRTPPSVTLVQLNDLKRAWADKFADKLKGKNMAGKMLEFQEWVRNTTNGQVIDRVNEFQSWTAEEYALCMEELAK